MSGSPRNAGRGKGRGRGQNRTKWTNYRSQKNGTESNKKEMKFTPKLAGQYQGYRVTPLKNIFSRKSKEI